MNDFRISSYNRDDYIYRAVLVNAVLVSVTVVTLEPYRVFNPFSEDIGRELFNLWVDAKLQRCSAWSRAELQAIWDAIYIHGGDIDDHEYIDMMIKMLT